MSVINDGTGKGNKAKVDGSNRLHAYAVTRSEAGSAVHEERAYNINTGLITLTTAGESGVCYVYNNEPKALIVTGIVAILGPSTGGASTDITRVRIYKNVTTGTLVSAATDVDTISNRDFGSSETLTANVYKGTEGSTITDGTVHIESLINPGSRVFFAIDEELPKGHSIAVSFEPNDSNTSMKCMAAVICHLEDEELE